MITMLLYEHKEKCGCKINFDVTVEEDDSPPTYELWVNRIFGDNECEKHPDTYFDEEWFAMTLPTSLEEIEEIAGNLKKFVLEEKERETGDPR